ncbi:hypothetical protein BH24ACT2_BH24ACT2_08670 [soil metagenome]
MRPMSDGQVHSDRFYDAISLDGPAALNMMASFTC